jgi:hypothetical protein
LVAVDVEKLTTTSRPAADFRTTIKSRQETQSTAAFVKPSTASSGATAASGETTGGLEVETPTCLQDNSWDSYKTAEKFFWQGLPSAYLKS